MTRSTLHIRLPQRADAIEGKEQQPGNTVPPNSAPDPRTISQDPVQKPSKVQKAADAIVAELDQGPLGA